MTLAPCTCAGFATSFGDRAYLALTLRRRPNDQLRLHDLATLAAPRHVPTVVTNDVLFHEPGAPHPAGCGDLHPPQVHRSRRSAIAANVTPTAI